MAFPKKKSRKITVDNHNYLWIARGKAWNNEWIDLSIMSAEVNGQKLFAQYNYNTIDVNSNKYETPFIITPFIVRKTIIYGLENGYTPKQSGSNLNLGNLSNVFDVKVSGQENTRRLLRKVENFSFEQFRYSDKDEQQVRYRKNVQNIITEAKNNILNGEWFTVFIMLLKKLHNESYKIDNEILTLIKLIFKNETIDWKIDYYWIETFEIIEELYPEATGVFKKS